MKIDPKDIHFTPRTGWVCFYSVGQWELTLEYDFGKWLLGFEFAYRFYAVNLLFIRIHYSWL